MAFRSGDAQALRALLPGEAKVRVDLRDLTDGSRSYGPGQLEVVFQQIFQAQHTGKLRFRPEDVNVAAPGTAFARGRWTRRSAPAGGATVDFVTFTLRAQDGDWRIHEILCSR
jgi:ketosteroid isomerase-like protein